MSRASEFLHIRPAPRPPDPTAGGPFRRAWARLRWPFLSLYRQYRSVWLLTRGVAPAKRWRPSLPRRAVIWASVLVTVVLVLWVAKAVVALATGGEVVWGWPWGIDPDSVCDGSSASCDVVSGSVFPIATLALTTVFFLAWRFRSLRVYYMRRARREPRSLVESSGSIMGRVVGRDQLCIALMDNLRDTEVRRPHVVVGAIGTGKTALVVRLTGLLARKGAFPVPIRLRDAENDLDFADLAYERFRRVVEPRSRSDAESEKVWRELRHSDRVVVLADGLEEALSGDGVRADRDNLIRKAVRAAGEARLPLVITSRPHDALRAVEAAVTELEPLSAEAALEYMTGSGGRGEDGERLGRIIEIADVTESPLYLQIAKDLHRKDLLRKVWVGEEETAGAGADHTMWELKFDLIEAWVAALVDGDLHPELPITREERRVTVEYLSALACIGLRRDTAQVRFVRLDEERAVGAELAHRRRDVPIDVRLAATWGTRMGIVEESGEYVRFQHSIMQAYLGSRFLDAVLDDHLAFGPSRSDYFPEALRDPGREILIAMVFHSRRLQEDSRCTCPAVPDGHCPIRRLRDLVVAAACEALPGERAAAPSADPVGEEARASAAKVLDMYGAALDIDAVDLTPDPDSVVASLVPRWGRLQERDPQRLRAAKLALVKRLGAASRRAALGGGSSAYGHLFEIVRDEPVYRVRTAMARELGSGGDRAYEVLSDRLRRPARTVSATGPAAPPDPAAPPAATPGPVVNGGGERVRRKREGAARAEQCRRDLRYEEEEARQEKGAWNENTMCARLVPMLVESVTSVDHAGTPYQDLKEWLAELAARDGHLGPDPYGKRGLEVAMALGFKHAANRRAHLSGPGDARRTLKEQAEVMLRGSRFWFTRLTLLHALTLWALPDDATGERPEHGPGARPKEQVRRWLQLRDGEREHPLVEAGARLAVWALETRRPERFLWIDEAAVGSQVGSEPGRYGWRGDDDLWIPPSAGWSTLDPDAQKLLADVILLISLTERADRPRDLIGRLDVAPALAPVLPPCLSGDRATLNPTNTVAVTPGGRHCHDSCDLKLCPYPPKIPDLRVELGEVFCLHQRGMLGFWQPRSWVQLRFRRKGTWQRDNRVAGLRQFWEQMGARARDTACPDEERVPDRAPRPPAR